VIDINEKHIIKTRELLENELATFDPELPGRPSITVITKTDTTTAARVKTISKKLPDDYLFLSAVSRAGADDFLVAIERKLDEQRVERTSD
jgi:GTPase involved in cell partitioning and DNA repair